MPQPLDIPKYWSLALIAETVGQCCDDMLTASTSGVISVDWSDQGEVTIVVREGVGTATFRLTAKQLA